MKESPILFNDEMVRALLDGRKTQTRRIIKPTISDVAPSRPLVIGPLVETASLIAYDENGHLTHRFCPYGQPGDRLWVREAHALLPVTAYAQSIGVDIAQDPDDDYEAAIYRAGWDRSTSGFRWRPSIHMPRWACRLLLEVTDLRVERLQDISETDALAEGVDGEAEAAAASLPWHDNPRRAFRFLWKRINGPDSWDANPWVWVVEFRRLDAQEVAA